jgi:hypothetical protein
MHASVGQHWLGKVLFSAIFNPSLGPHPQPPNESEISRVELGSNSLNSKSLKRADYDSIPGFSLPTREHPFSALLVSALSALSLGMKVKEVEEISSKMIVRVKMKMNGDRWRLASTLQMQTQWLQ